MEGAECTEEGHSWPTESKTSQIPASWYTDQVARRAGAAGEGIGCTRGQREVDAYAVRWPT